MKAGAWEEALTLFSEMYLNCKTSKSYESWVVPAGVPSALADIGGGVEANY